jgi:hypothetical protein
MYLKRLQALGQPDPADPPGAQDPNSQELDKLKAQALRVLESGYGRLGATATIDRATLAALLSLAQAYVDSGQPMRAVEVLENARCGPLALVQRNHAAATEASLVEETYKTALRAYIGALTVAPDRAAMLGKAQETMTRMKSAIGSAEGGQARLVAVFVSLARNIEDQIKVASPDARAALSSGIESFLKQIRDQSTEFGVLNWVAETFMSLGSGLESGAENSPDAARFYQESKATFQKILDETKPESQYVTQVRLRLAAVARKQRVDTYARVLGENAMRVNVQVEAAKAYQEWASAAGQESNYERAMGGGAPGSDGRNVIWGWGRIAQVTSPHPQFRDTFHEANVQMAWCRLLLAERRQGAEKDRLLKSALNGLTVVRRLYPQLGGESWLAKYDSVLRRIQQAMGQNPAGVKGLEG